MAVLTRSIIVQEIADGRLKISPLSEDQIGVASIDLTLGREIRNIVSDESPIDILEDTDHVEHTQVISLDEPYLLQPGETIHGITEERVNLPPDLCGFLEGRSRFARLGLMIHVTSALVQPGVDNHQVLEMSNVAQQPLRIHAGVRVCQLVLMRTEGTATYRGRFANQTEV
jgi:dCTP deaminase